MLSAPISKLTVLATVSVDAVSATNAAADCLCRSHTNKFPCDRRLRAAHKGRTCLWLSRRETERGSKENGWRNLPVKMQEGSGLGDFDADAAAARDEEAKPARTKR